ncbi:hypothetical protein MTR_2g037415 [Medicago truncatula]|uniref:Uncharacterized protein n=1 Tax=Medicago truncatula TaxID=3880 RepID=A0A072V5Y1_MEDTR|nr:hypothetical protein MTR_2g037415 [Medicago truncatula]
MTVCAKKTNLPATCLSPQSSQWNPKFGMSSGLPPGRKKIKCTEIQDFHHIHITPYSTRPLKKIATGLKSRMQYLDMDLTPTDIQYTTEFWTNGKNKVDELTDDQRKLTKSSITTVGEKRNYAIYDFTSNTKMNDSLERLEASQISDEPDSIIYGIIDNRNSVEIDSTPTPNEELIIIIDDDDDEVDIRGRTGFNQQEGINAKKEFVEPKDDQEKQIESSNTTVK